ncbi:hypothetical protein IC220_04790 [Wolbachia endosymbiont of Pentalonia nigronervosa]|jgi:hypothetical protein|uniref:hypothetical protein n=1 Tax=Wolbachia endosymbiont of Pentalonia nigronervosa TaxID=1301914 RepID=UPI00165F81BB|nr:hypothetical protein [Wolbachia endosymbiont of Pentalonia nigronervosa]MBD0391757.1 hypothetical protein [Wolbachia endosymbiont of Pentalonia nigronervosa]
MGKKILEIVEDISLEGAIAGSIIGFGLSFTTLSPLVIGGIIGCSFWAGLAVVAVVVGCVLYIKDKKAPSNCGQVIMGASKLIITASVVGVALGAVAHSLFPGVMLSTWPAILVGAVIGVTGTVSAALVKDYIIDPIVEKVTQCFSKEAYI